MKKLIYSFIFFNLLGCKVAKQHSYGYFLKNSLTMNKGGLNKFYSYKNYIFEFVNKSSTNEERNIVNSNSKITVKDEVEYIYLLDIKKKIIFKYESFTVKPLFKEIISYDIKKGFKIDTLDEFSKKCILNSPFKDTFVNNLKLKYYDTLFNFKGMDIQYYFFLQEKKFNTLFEIKNSELQEKISPLTFHGLSAFYNKKEIFFTKIDSIFELNNNEMEICESIIKDSESRKLKK